LAPLINGLVGYWPFNETSGTVANDLSGNGNNGTLVNGTLVNQAGKVGTAFKFDGTNDYVTLTYNNSTSQSYSFWIYPTSVTDRKLFGKQQNGVWDEQIAFVGGKIRYYPWTQPDLGDYIDSPVITINTWYHVVATRGFGTTAKLYINGVKYEGTNVSNSLTYTYNTRSGFPRGSAAMTI
jgi:hypothetical protein